MMESELLLPSSNFSLSTYQNPNDFDDEFLSWFDFQDEFFYQDNILIRDDDDDDFEMISTRDVDEICDWINGNHSEGNSSSSAEARASADEWSPSPSMAINFPADEPDNELSLLHLSRAYGEAIDGGSNASLAKVIAESIKEKSSPQGNTTERVAYHMFKAEDDDGEYLRQESGKNFVTAFNVAYQTQTCGRFAHNAANAAIMESIPDDATVVHIVEFDVGEGIQWPALFEAMSRKQTPARVRLTSMKFGQDCTSSNWEFEETKRRLQDHARQYGIRLQVEEKGILDFTAEMMRRRKKGRGKEWLVFNLMVALPHMARRRRRSRVVEFLNMAEELLGSYYGIVTFGEGEAGEEVRDYTSFASYFGKLHKQYLAVFESLERSFPVYLAEARTAVECTFLGPFTCPGEWFEEWKEMAEGGGFETGLERGKVSRESLCEAKVMVSEGENSYNVMIDGVRDNEMVLRWKETIIGRFSVFCSRR